MNEKIDIRQALRVFDKMTIDGQRIGNEYHLDDLVAYTDFDGYTVTIRSNHASLDVFFHNKFSFKYTNDKEKAFFLKKIDELDQ